MKKCLFVFLFLCPFLQGYSQFILRKQVLTPQPADSLDIAYYSKKKPWQAGATVFGLNMGVWAFDRYIQQADFAYISLNSIRDNFKNGFRWDNDQMGTNLFLHPYHGNLYYNAARSNGFNYWISGAYAFGGSAMWELFMESEPPSTNDIIATPFGGMAIGEVFYRFSDMILDDTRRGRNRVWRETAAFIVSPMRGLTRIINGDAWKKRPSTGRQFGVPEVSFEVSTGLRILELRDQIFDTGVGIAVDLNIEYGDKYENEGTGPYDYFNIRTNFNIHSSQPLLSQLNIVGRLWSTDLFENKTDYLGIGVYQHFDYYDSDTISTSSNRTPYKFGAPASFGVGVVHKSKRSKELQMSSYAHFNGIILGTSLSDHYIVDKRNYNLGSGFGWKFGVNISYKDKIGAAWWYEGYRLFTWKGYPEGYELTENWQSGFDAQGDQSNATLNTTSIKTDIKLRKQFYLSGIGSIYRRSTHYEYFNTVYSITAEGRILLTYKF